MRYNYVVILLLILTSVAASFAHQDSPKANSDPYQDRAAAADGKHESFVADKARANQTSISESTIARATASGSLIVPDDCATIQCAIDLALPGDSVLVRPGSYNENILLNKAIVLQSFAGSDNTSIVATSPSANVVTVTVDGAMMNGFSISGGNFGIFVVGSVSTVEVTDCKVSDTSNYQVFTPPTAVPGVLNGLELVEKPAGWNAVMLLGGTVSNSATWPALPPGFSYFLPFGPLEVEGIDEPVLRLQPGTVIKLFDDAQIIVGDLWAGGLIADSVIVTSYQDDTVGGDTNGDGASSSPAPGQWRGLYVGTSALADSCVFTGCEFRFGGRDGYDMVEVRVPATYTGCEFYRSGESGLYALDTAPNVTGCTFTGNRCGLELGGAPSVAGITGNTIDHDGSDGYLFWVVAECVRDVMNQNTLVGRADARYGRLRIKESTLTRSVTWPVPPEGMSYYLEDEILTIGSSYEVVLNLLPNTVIKLRDDAQIHVGLGGRGGLSADSVIVTSDWDDTVGGDTNGDGAASSPAPGQWRGLFVGTSGDPCWASNCEFRYGGQDGFPMVDVRKPAAFTGCEFYRSGDAGLYALDAAPNVTGCTFTGNRYGLELEGASAATGISGNTIDHDGSDGYLIWVVANCVEKVMNQNTFVGRPDTKFGRLRIKGSTLTASATWPTPPAGLSYYLENESLYINNDIAAILHLLPQTVIKLRDDASINVGRSFAMPFGGLIADGVIMTSYRDDTVGGDSNGDGASSSAAPGQWRGLHVGYYAWVDSCLFTGCEFRYGGQDGYPMVELRKPGPSATFTGCEFYRSGDAGLYALAAAPNVTGSTFTGNQYGLELDDTSSAAGISGNTFDHESSQGYLIWVTADCVEDVMSHNTLVGRLDTKYGRLRIKESTLTASATWPAPPSDLSYYLAHDVLNIGDPTLPGTVLRLLPNTVIKLWDDARIHVGNGATSGLIADSVIVTSHRDDTVGGDTDGNGSSLLPEWGQWEQLLVGSDAIADSCVFTGCEFRYGGKSDQHMVDVSTAATFYGCTFQSSHSAGLRLRSNSTQPAGISYCQFVQNRYGLRSTDNGRADWVEQSCFENNTEYGILVDPYTDGLGPMDATNCWWGDPTGPGGSGPGLGDNVSTDVSYDPWAKAPVCQPPTATQEDTPSPVAFAALPAAPNPFNPSTTIKYELPVSCHVSLKIYTARGEFVTELIDTFKPQGFHSVTWTGTDRSGGTVSSGVYFYVFQAENFRQTRKLVLLK